MGKEKTVKISSALSLERAETHRDKAKIIRNIFPPGGRDVTGWDDDFLHFMLNYTAKGSMDKRIR